MTNADTSHSSPVSLLDYPDDLLSVIYRIYIKDDERLFCLLAQVCKSLLSRWKVYARSIYLTEDLVLAMMMNKSLYSLVRHRLSSLQASTYQRWVDLARPKLSRLQNTIPRRHWDKVLVHPNHIPIPTVFNVICTGVLSFLFGAFVLRVLIGPSRKFAVISAALWTIFTGEQSFSVCSEPRSMTEISFNESFSSRFIETLASFVGKRFVFAVVLGEPWIPYIKTMVSAVAAMSCAKINDMERFGLLFAVFGIFLWAGGPRSFYLPLK